MQISFKGFQRPVAVAPRFGNTEETADSKVKKALRKLDRTLDNASLDKLGELAANLAGQNYTPYLAVTTRRGETAVLFIQDTNKSRYTTEENYHRVLFIEPGEEAKELTVTSVNHPNRHAATTISTQEGVTVTLPQPSFLGERRTVKDYMVNGRPAVDQESVN
jgi:hypothetical protein